MAPKFWREIKYSNCEWFESRDEVTSLDSEDDFRSGCRNATHQQKCTNRPVSGSLSIGLYEDHVGETVTGRFANVSVRQRLVH